MSDDAAKKIPTTVDVPTTNLPVKPCPGKPENFIVTPKGGWAARCWGKRRDTQERCKRPAAHGTRFCRRHGAMVKKGPVHPNWKGGVTTRAERWLKLIPQTEQGDYLAALNDPDLLGASAEIMALSARAGELLQRATNGKKVDWSELESAFDMLDGGMKSENSAMMAGGLTQLRHLIKEGSSGDRAWDRFSSTADRKQRLIESERKRAIEANLYLTREQAAAFGHALLQSVARHVQDQAAVVRIVEDFSGIIASLHSQAGTIEVG
jgi:hypothetical protein